MIPTLILKELKGIIRDKGIFMMLVAGPIFYAFFYPFPYSKAIVRDVPVAVVDMDKTANSYQLSRMLDASEEVRVVKDYVSLEQAERGLGARKIFGIVYIEKDFQKNILKNKPQKVKIYTDGSYLVYYKQVTTAAQRAVKTMSGAIEIKKLQSRGMGKAAYVLRAPIKTVSKNLYNPSGSYTEYIVPAVFITLVQQVLLMAIAMRAGTLRENRKKYARQIKPWHILLSKTAAFMCFALFHFLLFFIIAYNLYGFSGGRNVLGMFIFYIPFALASILLGISMAGLFKDRETPVMFMVVTSLPLVFMSGALWPVYLMPWFLKVIRLFVPMTYGITAVTRVYIMDAGLSSAAWEFWACWGLVILFGLGAYIAIKKRYPHKV